MVTHAQAPVTPYYGGAACAAASGDARAAFAIFLRVPAFWGEPVEGVGGCGEGTGCGS